jgi:CheY-like chemotaxis protein
MNAVDSRPILLVEDNPFDLDLTLRAFARRNLVNPIEVARDGQEVIEYFTRLSAEKEEASFPVIILLDLKLPKVDGLEVLRWLKNHPRYRLIPVVVLTTSADDHDVQTAYSLGASSYIVKPVDFQHFMEVVAHIQLYWTVVNLPSNP